MRLRTMLLYLGKRYQKKNRWFKNSSLSVKIEDTYSINLPFFFFNSTNLFVVTFLESCQDNIFPITYCALIFLEQKEGQWKHSLKKRDFKIFRASNIPVSFQELLQNNTTAGFCLPADDFVMCSCGVWWKEKLFVAFPLIQSSFWEVRNQQTLSCFHQELRRKGMLLCTLANSSFILALFFPLNYYTGIGKTIQDELKWLRKPSSLNIPAIPLCCPREMEITEVLPCRLQIKCLPQNNSDSWIKAINLATVVRQLGSYVILAENKAKVMASCSKLSPRRRGSEQLSPLWAQHGLAEASRRCCFCWACGREPAAWAKPQLWEWFEWLPDSLCGSLWPTSCNTAVHKQASLPEL